MKTDSLNPTIMSIWDLINNTNYLSLIQMKLISNNLINKEENEICKLEDKLQDHIRTFDALNWIFKDLQNSMKAACNEITQLTNHNTEIMKKCSFIEEKLSVYQQRESKWRYSHNPTSRRGTDCSKNKINYSDTLSYELFGDHSDVSGYSTIRQNYKRLSFKALEEDIDERKSSIQQSIVKSNNFKNNNWMNWWLF